MLFKRCSSFSSAHTKMQEPKAGFAAVLVPVFKTGCSMDGQKCSTPHLLSRPVTFFSFCGFVVTAYQCADITNRFCGEQCSFSVKLDQLVSFYRGIEDAGSDCGRGFKWIKGSSFVPCGDIKYSIIPETRQYLTRKFAKCRLLFCSSLIIS